MAIEAHRTSVATSATPLNTAPASAGYVGACSVLVRNRDATASVFLGGSGVTIATGFELLAGESLPMDLEAGDMLYGICATGTVACHVLAVGV